eukprot:3642652-Pleurochrysis_carterae.AAC.1
MPFFESRGFSKSSSKQLFRAEMIHSGIANCFHHSYQTYQMPSSFSCTTRCVVAYISFYGARRATQPTDMIARQAERRQKRISSSCSVMNASSARSPVVIAAILRLRRIADGGVRLLLLQGAARLAAE